MENQLPFTLTNESITVVFKGKPHVVQKGTPQFTALRVAILNEDWDAIPNSLTVAKALKEWAKDHFTLKENTFSFDGIPLPENINQRIIEMATAGEDPTSFFKFYERLQKNPSMRSVEQLWPFLEHAGIPLTKDGFFLAYKGVLNNYKDAHSGMISNKPGCVNEMPRNQISDDPNHACHEGYHVGALSYAQGFSQRVVVCEVDPENVVCVPYDASQQKMRVCKYKVLGNHNGTLLPSTTFEDDKVTPLEGATPKAKKKSGKKRAKAWKLLEPMGMEDLLKQPNDVLRLYATQKLKITGASKIPGGKVALVAKILEVREPRDAKPANT